MDWEAIGAVAEMLAAVGVIASLIFVGLQVRHSTDVAKATARQAVADSSARWSLAVVDSADISRIIVKSREDMATLTPEERIQLLAYARTNLRMIENVFFQYRKGLIEEPEWRAYRGILAGVTNQSDEIWEQMRSAFPRDFVDEVERVRTEERQAE